MVALNLNKKMGVEEEDEVKRENALNRTVPIKKIDKLRDPNPGARHYVLRVTIYDAEGIDPPSLWPEVQCRNYRTILWVNSFYQYATEKVGGFPSVTWAEEFNILLTPESSFLNLEVIMERSRCDPGPSMGVVVVGRARVALPEVPRTKQSRRVGLVRLVEGKTVGQGHITIAMKLVVVNEQWREVF